MEHLDDFIKGKLDQAPIAFNEAHWLQAAQLIEQQEEGLRRRYLMWSVIVQVAILVLIPFFLTLDKTEVVSDVVVADQIVSPNSSDVSTLNKKEEAIVLTKSSTPSAVKTTPPGDVQNALLITKSTQQNLQETQHFNENNNTVSISPSVNLNSEGPSSSFSKGQDATLSRVFNAQAPQEIPRLSEIDKGQLVIEPTLVNAIEEIVHNGTPNILLVKDPNNQNTQEALQLNKEEALVVINQSSRPTTIEASSSNDAQYVMTIIKLLPPLTIGTPFSNTDQKTLNAEGLGLITPKIHQEKHPYHSLVSLYAASTMYPYTQIGAKKILGYIAGIHYNRNIKKAWSIDAGLHYRTRDGSFTNSQTTVQDSFAFRRISTEHSLKASQMHTIEVPLTLLYNKKRHSIQVGFSYVRLLGLRGSLNKINNPEALSPTASIVKKGWIEDTVNFKVNRFDVLAGYYFTLKPGLKIGASVHYALGGFLNKNTAPDLYLESKPLSIDFEVHYDLIKR